ncbi:hypothetical protein EVAR_60702_1 [Eumeta japonica]|uniref:Uncharacterized protein n=1 Tax=Eumeta variegata TaxID=151549 RepID=A0A4C1Z7T0_EUMVA|nr:hypothetical protein EVAR_60702_1 [Eumeta japonica]
MNQMHKTPHKHLAVRKLCTQTEAQNSVLYNWRQMTQIFANSDSNPVYNIAIAYTYLLALLGDKEWCEEKKIRIKRRVGVMERVRYMKRNNEKERDRNWNRGQD